jgi:hypothetical protein
MKKRCFAFGCSYTKWLWPTWADFIGKNFDEYYNFGIGGASNNYIMNRVIEVDSILNFNPETDYVVIGLSGFNRFSFLPDSTKLWKTNGDLDMFVKETSNKEVGNFYNNLWSTPAAVYYSWIAIKTIKTFLVSKKIKHKIIMAIDNSHYKTDYKLLGLSRTHVKYVRDIYSLLDVELSIDNFLQLYKFDYIYFTKDKEFEAHPSPSAHFAFLKMYFPEFITEKSKSLLKDANTKFKYRTREEHKLEWEQYCDTFMKSQPISLIGNEKENKMILFTNGCSWTWGGGLESKYTTDEERLELCWPHHLGEKLECSEVVNLGTGCGSNQRIIRTTFEWLQKMTETELRETVAVIQLTEPSRYEYYQPEVNEWAKCKVDQCIQSSERPILALTRANLRLQTFTDQEAVYTYLSTMFALAKLFETFKVKKYFIWGLQSFNTTSFNVSRTFDSISLVDLENIRLGCGAWEYDIVGMLNGVIDQHPSVIGHKQISEIIFKKIKDRL